MSRGRGQSRRAFLTTAAAAGGGLFVGIRAGRSGAQPGPTRTQPALLGEHEINAWVVVRPDETVTIRVARSEIGQGTTTGLAQLVADELDCDWAKVSTEAPPPGISNANDRVWKDFAASNGRGIRASQDYMRLAGATARWLLVEAAAEASEKS